MQLNRKLEQQIAVFGESGSGKTVLLSSFYGATQEPQFLNAHPYNVVAEDIGQGSRLHRNFLGMREEASPPAANRFASTSYAFSMRFRGDGDVKASRRRGLDGLRLIWHDYPGEWFSQEPSSAEEGQRRVDTFRTLLSSDVAMLLVDAQLLSEHAGEEERYLRSLFANFRNGLLSLRNDILADNEPLVTFPRIWVIALSKCDLLPDVDVFQFRDLLISKACDDIHALREVIAGMVDTDGALSVGEDFVVLSSAKFTPGHIEVNERVGVDLIFPISALLPLQRFARWQQTLDVSKQLGARMLLATADLAAAALSDRQYSNKVLSTLMSAVLKPSLTQAADLAGQKLQEANDKATAQGDVLRATLTQFGLDLEQAESDRVLLRSRR